MSRKDEKKGEALPKAQAKPDRRNFLKLAGAGVVGAAVGAIIEYPILSNEVQNANNQLQTANQQVAMLTTQLQQANALAQQANAQFAALQAQGSAFLSLNIGEQALLESVVETIIPTDSSGPGAKEAGVIYFIDKQLVTDYGKSANVYMKGPFVPQGLTGPITVGGITYPGGTPSVPYASGQRLQYSMDMKEFWRIGLEALQAYCKSKYGGNFETLSATQKTQALTDLYNNVPTSFGSILPQDFFMELIFMTWSGFLMDPAYGGNWGMVGWKHVGFNGVNMGNFYGEGLHTTALMVDNKPTRLQPASLGQFQKGAP